MIKYIHYGCSSFDYEKFNVIQNRPMFVKPFGGLWASRTDAENGWKDWCVNNEFAIERLSECFTFTLKEDANVVTIRSVEDLKKLPCIDNRIMKSMYLIDFEQMVKDGIDAIELVINYDLYFALYGWDCDSILIMNPDIIVQQ